MYVRVASYEVPEEKLADALESFREASTEIERLEGFEKGYIFAGAEGRLVTVTFWRSLSDLEATETRASLIRRNVVQAVAGDVRSVEHFEVAAKLSPVAGSPG